MIAERSSEPVLEGDQRPAAIPFCGELRDEGTKDGALADSGESGWPVLMLEGERE